MRTFLPFRRPKFRIAQLLDDASSTGGGSAFAVHSDRLRYGNIPIQIYSSTGTYDGAVRIVGTLCTTGSTGSGATYCHIKGANWASQSICDEISTGCSFIRARVYRHNSGKISVKALL